MIWCAVLNSVVSRVYVDEKGETMNRERYQCILKSHLGPFIDTQCGGYDNFIFWPDLTISHYATDVQTGLTSENIDFVKRENNPPNCPQLRQFQHFGSFRKLMV